MKMDAIAKLFGKLQYLEHNYQRALDALKRAKKTSLIQPIEQRQHLEILKRMRREANLLQLSLAKNNKEEFRKSLIVFRSLAEIMSSELVRVTKAFKEFTPTTTTTTLYPNDSATAERVYH